MNRLLLLIPLLPATLCADRFEFRYAFEDHVIAGQFTGSMSGGEISDPTDFWVTIDGMSEPWRTSDTHPIYSCRYDHVTSMYTTGPVFSPDVAADNFFIGNGDFANGDLGGNWYFGIYVNETGLFVASLIVLGGAIPDGEGGFIAVDSFIVHDTAPSGAAWSLTPVPDSAGLVTYAAAVTFLLLVAKVRRG